MPFPLFPLCAARCAEAKTVPEAQGEQGQQPREGVTQEHFSVLSFSSVLCTTSLSHSVERTKGREWAERGIQSPWCLCCTGMDRRSLLACPCGGILRHTKFPQTNQKHFVWTVVTSWCSALTTLLTDVLLNMRNSQQQQVGADLNVQLLGYESAFVCFIL